MTKRILETKDTTILILKRFIRRTTAVFVSLVVFFFSFFHTTPDYKLIHNHKPIGFGINYVFAQGDAGDGGDGGDAGDAGDGGDSGDAGDAGDGGDSGDSGGAGAGDGGGDSSGAGASSGGSGDSGSGDAGDSGDVGDAGDAGDGGDSGGDSGDSGGAGGGPSGGPGGVGGAGGLNAPSVSVSSLPGVSEQPLAFITLSQIPYTGFKAGIIVTGLYWFVLMLWSGFLAYFLLTRKFGVKAFYSLKHAFTIGGMERTREPERINDISFDEPFENTIPETQHSSLSPSVEGRERNEEAPYLSDTLVLEMGKDGVSPRLELKRPTSAHIAVSEKHAFIPERTSSSDSGRVNTGWQHTEESKISQFSSPSELIKAVVHGNTNQVLEIIHAYKATGQNMPDILVRMLCELDRLYCRRIGEKETLSDESIEDSFEGWGNGDIERLVHILSTGIDQNYLTQHTSAKMALLRAVEYACERRPKGQS